MPPLLHRTLARVARGIGRDSTVVRALGPVYERWLRWRCGSRGLAWSVNGMACRVDPGHRHRIGRVYDPEVAAYLSERIAPGSVCFDVGANVGVYVLQMAEWSGSDGRVIAFEPNPAAADVLEHHVAINGLGARVEVVRSAVSERTGSAEMHVEGVEGTNRLNEPHGSKRDRTRAIDVPVTTIDSFARETGTRPDWMLVDVEGFEADVLRGARAVVRGNPELGLVVEMHPNTWATMGTTPEDVGALIAGLGRRPVGLTGQGDPLREYGLVVLECEG